jgi:hypothetical protein
MLSKILGLLAGLGSLAALFFRGQVHKEKAERKDDEIKRAKVLAKQSKKADEALIKGLENESKPSKRGFFDSID